MFCVTGNILKNICMLWIWIMLYMALSNNQCLSKKPSNFLTVIFEAQNLRF